MRSSLSSYLQTLNHWLNACEKNQARCFSLFCYCFVLRVALFADWTRTTSQCVPPCVVHLCQVRNLFRKQCLGGSCAALPAPGRMTKFGHDLPRSWLYQVLMDIYAQFVCVFRWCRKKSKSYTKTRRCRLISRLFTRHTAFRPPTDATQLPCSSAEVDVVVIVVCLLIATVIVRPIGIMSPTEQTVSLVRCFSCIRELGVLTCMLACDDAHAWWKLFLE